MNDEQIAALRAAAEKALRKKPIAGMYMLNPDAVLSLLARAEAAEAERDALETTHQAHVAARLALLARAEAAEKERDRWKLQSDGWQKRGGELEHELEATEAALATARADLATAQADGLNEAAAKCRHLSRGYDGYGCKVLNDAADAILSLIPTQEAQHD